MRRCHGHSRDPLNVAKRQAEAAEGRAAGARQRGVASNERSAVLAGIVPIEKAREDQSKAKDRKKTAARINLDSRDSILAFLGDTAGELMEEKPTGWAAAAAALARTALAALGLDDGGDDDPEEKRRGFSYETTAGEAVQVKPRDELVQ